MKFLNVTLLFFVIFDKKVFGEKMSEHCNAQDTLCENQQDKVKEGLKKILLKEPKFKALFGKVSNVNVLEGFFKEAIKKYQKIKEPYQGTVFENHRKSLIQHCERSELRLHFEWTKVHQNMPKWSILASF